MAGVTPKHQWVAGPYCRAPVSGGGCHYYIDSHRNHRGPYTAAGELVRHIVRRAHVTAGDLAPAQQLTLLSAAPEFRETILVAEDVTKALTFSVEGRVPTWTQRLAHGLIEFFLEYFNRASTTRCCVSFDHVEHADPVDQEFIAVLLRRADPRRVLVRIRTSTDTIGEPLLTALTAHAHLIEAKAGDGIAARKIRAAWHSWLNEHAGLRGAGCDPPTELAACLDLAALPQPPASPAASLEDAIAKLPPAVRQQLARKYVESDCTSDNVLAQRAYDGLEATERRELHRVRALYLENLDQQSLSLGAIPFHHEQAGDDVEPLLAASRYCLHMDYYEAARDWAARGRRMLDPLDRGETYVGLTRNLLFASLLLRRIDDVEALCAENLRESDPILLGHASFAMGMLNARFYEPSRRDYDAAKMWIERSLAFTARRPLSPKRTLNLAFLRNAMALVELRRGHPAAAEQVLSEGIDLLAAQAPELYETDCGIFLHNRARLHMVTGHIERAMEELTGLLRHEPSSSEAYCDRALLYHRSGQYENALLDCDAAIKWSPPYPEPHLNRAASLIALGRREEALAEYDYVLILEPNHLGALTDRALLLHKQGRLAAARDDVEQGLRLNPAHARLLCLRGLIELKERNLDAAFHSFGEAIEADGSFADAWANRATVSFRRGDLEAALRDLTRALNLREDPAALYNRGRVLEASRRWRQAAADHERALALVSGDAPHIHRHLVLCRQAIEAETGVRDFER